MAKTRQQKETEIKKIQDNLNAAKTVVFATFNGLKVKDSRELRNNARKENVSFLVSKKTLLKKVLTEAKLSTELVDQLQGNVGVAYGLTDEVAPAKILADFSKKHEQVQIQGGLLEKVFVDKEKIKILANLPSKLELLAKVAASVKAPINGLVNVLAGNLRGLVIVLNSIKEKKI